MALDIFNGNGLVVSVGTYGATASTTFTKIPEVATFVQSGGSSEVINVTTYGKLYQRKLIGTKSVPDLTCSVNWIPDNAIHQQLIDASDEQTRIQIKIEYYQDMTHTAGYYVVYNCFVSSDTVSGGQNDATLREFVFAVDGGPVAAGIIQ